MRILQIRTTICIMNLWGKMNLRWRYSGLILGLALLLFSCEDPGTIGLESDSNNLDFRVTYQRFELPATLVQIDSIPTQNSGRVLAGKYSDSQFGSLEATGYAELWLTTNPVVDSAAIYDSLILQLKYDYVHGKDILAENTLEVYALEQELTSIESYYSFSELPYSDISIGSTTFNYPLVESSEEIVEFDTTLRVALSDDLGREFLSKILDENDTTFDSNVNFTGYFPGVVLKAGNNYETVTGFNATDNDTQMVLYYHYTDGNGDIQDGNVTFLMENSVHFNNFSYDRAGTPIGNVADNYTEYTASDGLLYVQSGTALVMKVDFQPYLDFTDTIESLIVNRADFTIGPVDEYTRYLVPPAGMIYYLTDSTNNRIRDESGSYKSIQQDNPSVDPAGVRFPIEANFNEEQMGYSDPISSYSQALFNGYVTESQILTYPFFTDLTSGFNRYILNPQNVVLEVYYSTSNIESPSN